MVKLKLSREDENGSVILLSVTIGIMLSVMFSMISYLNNISIVIYWLLLVILSGFYSFVVIFKLCSIKRKATKS